MVNALSQRKVVLPPHNYMQTQRNEAYSRHVFGLESNQRALYGFHSSQGKYLPQIWRAENGAGPRSQT